MQKTEEHPRRDTPSLPSHPPPHIRQTNRALTTKQTRFFSVLFLIAALMLGWVLWPFWQLLILAFLLAAVFNPIYRKLTRWLSPWLAAILTCALIVLIVFVPLFFCIGSLSQEAANLFQLGKDSEVLLKIQDFMQNNTLVLRFQETMAGYGFPFKAPDMTNLLTGFSKTVGLFVYNQASAWAANIMSFVLQFCILIVVAYFILIEMDNLLAFILRLSPLPDDHNQRLVDKFTRIAGVILIGNGLSCIIQGSLCGIFFAILGVKAPVLWGLIMGTLAFIPILGIGLVLLPTAVIFLLIGHLGTAIVTLVFYVILHYTVELLLKPKFVGSQLKMHALLVLLAIFGGISLFGVLGIVYGPLIVSLFFTLCEMYLNEYSQESAGRMVTADSDSEHSVT